MKGLIFLAIVLGVYTPLFSQWADDFSDGEFTTNPSWQGNTNDFIVDGEVLRLNALALTGSSYLTTTSNISLEASWTFYVKLDFNPSSSNYIKVYLMADSVNLGNAKNGYFVKIGGTTDEVSLYKIVNGSETLLIDGVDDRVDLSVVEITVNVQRNSAGAWELKTKLATESEFVLEASVNDLEIQKSSYFGVFCKYTSTRSTKFYIDDIIVTGNPYVDSDPPVLISTATPQSTQIILAFNEGLDSLESINLSHYSLNDSITPVSITAINTDTLLLNFTNKLALVNTLEINALPDLAGNTLDTLVQILFVDPSPYSYRDVVINEIFPDPNPQEDLPPFEFVELYNNSARIIELEGWQFTDGSKVGTFEKQLLFPDSFLIICPTEALSAYQLLGTTIGLTNWPSLNNGGDSLTLISKSGIIIDSLSYTIDWYNDTNKDNGGWSLEQINPNNACLGDCNWATSVEVGGGTPGRINSIFDLGLDEEPPKLLAIYTSSINTIKLVFNEALDTLIAKNTSRFILNQSITPSSITVVNSDTILIAFDSNLKLENTLELKGLADLVGNTLDTLMQVFYIDPSPFTFRDVVINEIFADPNPQEELPLFEFIELLNLSDRIIDLKGWQLSDGSKTASLTSHLLFPDSTLILCSEEAQEAYEAFGVTLAVSNFPSLNNNEDSLLLRSASQTTVDSLGYTTNWYKNSDKSDGGWSLEQINPQSKCLGPYNWIASTSSQGGTPGKTNSVYAINTDFEPPQITQALATDSLIELWFSEPVLPNSYLSTILEADENVLFNIATPAKYSNALISSNLEISSIYTIEIPLEDCIGNAGVSSYNLIPIASPNSSDIIINEILFDPFTGGADFVELLNTTDNYYNLTGYLIANEEGGDVISDTTLLLKPHNYIAFSEDILFLKNQYLAPDSSLFETGLPAMPNEEGVVVLKSNLGETIDSVFYSDEYHFSLIANVEGISLERISAQGESNSKDNWRSAAETTGYATPGYDNSQSRKPSETESVSVSPQVITPNNDGQADYCQVSFSLGNSSHTISINVYNLNGQLVKTIANNAIIAPSGFFTWDGTNQQGGVLPTAHYIIVSETISSDGRSQIFKNKVVVANGF